MTKKVLVQVSSILKKKSLQNRKKVEDLLRTAHLGDVECNTIEQLYGLEGNFSLEEIQRIAQELLCDPIAEKFIIDAKPKDFKTIFLDVWFKSGVTDPVAESVLKAIRDLNILTIENAFFGMRYEFKESAEVRERIADEKLILFANRHLLNPLVQQCQLIKYR
ncbi:MAG: phosphoribosylformylglycinamidine synthase subunit PurS [Elusimicrobia bacterium]|nr:phosphoribosylformylglycinamidine synthase subunit PurS [Elusimicrobiota bacterium]